MAIRQNPSLSIRIPTGKFRTGAEVQASQLSVDEIKKLAAMLKLPTYTVVRLHDLIVYSKLDKVV
jgi:hypothetical protein